MANDRGHWQKFAVGGSGGMLRGAMMSVGHDVMGKFLKIMLNLSNRNYCFDRIRGVALLLLVTFL